MIYRNQLLLTVCAVFAMLTLPVAEAGAGGHGQGRGHEKKANEAKKANEVDAVDVFRARQQQQELNPQQWQEQKKQIQRAEGVDGMQDPAGRRMRDLRLREAVQNGDISPEQARRNAMQPNRPWHAVPGGQESPDGQGSRPQHGQRNFWRDQRQKAQEQFQNE